MESELAQIKMLLWAILGLQVIFVVGNILCRIYGCGTNGQPDYNEWVTRGKFDQILSHTKKRLETHPDDTDALYFRAKALPHVGLIESAKECIKRPGQSDPRLAQVSREWLESLEEPVKSDS